MNEQGHYHLSPIIHPRTPATIMHTFTFLSFTGLASAFVPACLPELGPEFCPGTQIQRDNDASSYNHFRKENPAIFPSSMTQVG